MYVNMQYAVCVFRTILLFCCCHIFLSSGALKSPDLLPSYPTLIISFHITITITITIILIITLTSISFHLSIQAPFRIFAIMLAGLGNAELSALQITSSLRQAYLGPAQEMSGLGLGMDEMKEEWEVFKRLVIRVRVSMHIYMHSYIPISHKTSTTPIATILIDIYTQLTNTHELRHTHTHINKHKYINTNTSYNQPLSTQINHQHLSCCCHTREGSGGRVCVGQYVALSC